ncbi:hypothetical protein CHL76_08540 [Marinococcus halophilus]|uniref:Uncharacterized protein n=1 Tax=Marinococcus halophilus TaxID=1371 RepID=A0A510Y4F2_MARHA|nr:hypothetical protein CHL76_08540 [Marinococcus halophilus]GEK58194.1 hypothetical protein MHA01_10990 [Marinococcus halophilus]
MPAVKNVTDLYLRIGVYGKNKGENLLKEVIFAYALLNNTVLLITLKLGLCKEMLKEAKT